MSGGVIYKVYLAEQPGGKAYVGCTKLSPRARVGWFFHPARHDGAAVLPASDIVVTTLFYSTSIIEAAKYETAMIAAMGALHPRGLNLRAGSGYTGVGQARQLAVAAA